MLTMKEQTEEHNHFKMATREVEEQYKDQDAKCAGFGILGHYLIVPSIIIFTGYGFGMGLALSFWEPDAPDTQLKLLKWIGLIGDLFIRSLKCVILPLVCINVIIAVINMMSVGIAGYVEWKATLSASSISCLTWSLPLLVSSPFLSTSLFKTGNYPAGEDPAMVSLSCNAEGSFLVHDEWYPHAYF
jgi:hypothetical protein